MPKKITPQGRIRPVSPGDIDGIAAIEMESSVNPWKRSLFEEELSGGLSAFLVFCGGEENEVQGFIVYRRSVDSMDVFNIAVRKDSQRKGIGGALLAAVISEADSHQMSGVQLEVRSVNIPAIAMYKKAGFKKTGVRKNYYSNPVDDAIVLKLDIG